MKKISFIALLLLVLTSCKKESGCGVCVGVGTIDCSSTPCSYYLPVRFDDGHFSNVSVNSDTWVNTLEGERVCF
jgi:hypothetical protein